MTVFTTKRLSSSAAGPAKELSGFSDAGFAMSAVAPQNFWQTKHWTQDGEAVAHLDGSSTASCVSFPSMLNQVGNYLFYRSLSRGYSDMNCYRITEISSPKKIYMFWHEGETNIENRCTISIHIDFILISIF